MAAQAADRSSFSTSRAANGDLLVDINASISDKMLMCDIASFSQLSAKTITISLNGSPNTNSAADSQLRIPSSSVPSGNLQVSVNICGNSIKGS